MYHTLNRATARLTLFHKPADYDAFLRVLDEALQRHPTRLLAYCVMNNHWHLVLWPRREGLAVLRASCSERSPTYEAVSRRYSDVNAATA